MRLSKSIFLSLGGAILALFVLAACSGPVTQRFKIDETVLEAEAQTLRRLYIRKIGADILNYRDVGYRVLAGAVSLCPDNKLTFWSGFETWTADQFSSFSPKKKDKYRKATIAEYGVSDKPTVVKVYDETPAQRAGVNVGDIFVGIDEWRVDSSNKKKPSFWMTKQKGTDVKVFLDPVTLIAKQPHTFHFLRDGKPIEFLIRPIGVCDYNLLIQDGDLLNAMADGKNIIVDVRMLRWVGNNDQLGIIIGHELAHNIMKHTKKKKGNAAAGALLGGVFDLLFALGGVNTGGAFSDSGWQEGAKANSPEFESEADYVGLYAAALSHFDITLASDIWRRMSLEGTTSIDFTTTHPSNPYRMQALDKAVQEIQAKQARGAPLTPELKEGAKS